MTNKYDDIIENIEKTKRNVRIYNSIKLILILSIIIFCFYHQHTGKYYFLYSRILDTLITANVIWIIADVFYNPIKPMVDLIKCLKKTQQKI
jgi:hypothetical protein